MGDVIILLVEDNPDDAALTLRAMDAAMATFLSFYSSRNTIARLTLAIWAGRP